MISISGSAVTKVLRERKCREEVNQDAQQQSTTRCFMDSPTYLLCRYALFNILYPFLFFSLQLKLLRLKKLKAAIMRCVRVLNVEQCCCNHLFSLHADVIPSENCSLMFIVDLYLHLIQSHTTFRGIFHMKIKTMLYHSTHSKNPKHI